MAKTDPMTEDELLAVLRAEESDATSFYTSELAADQASAMERYFGNLYGNEIEGRSKVTTHDIEDTVNWMMPELMRVFMSADDLISVEPSSAEDEKNTDSAAQYLQHILFKDNPGAVLIHDFAFDALVQRLGVVSVMWEDPEPEPSKVLDNVTVVQLMRMRDDRNYAILEQEEIGPYGPGSLPTFRLRVQRRPKCGRVKIENVPPEEIALSRRARSFPSRKRNHGSSASYIRRKQEVFLADLRKQFPAKHDDLDDMTDFSGGNLDVSDGDTRILSRFQGEGTPIGNAGSRYSSDRRRKVYLYTEYIWIDYDADDSVELRRVLRVGKVILENEVVDDCEFKSWSPIRVAHKAIGRSIADTIIDLQKIRTALMRLMMDNLSQSLVPRNAVNMSMMDETSVDDLLDAEIGGVVRCKGDVRAAIMPLISPDVSQPAMAALEYIEQQSEQRSGVTRHAQGMDPAALTKTAAGIENLQAAAGERIAMVARWLGLAMEDILTRALELVIENQDTSRWVKIGGKPMDIDPRQWGDDMSVSVHVGMGGSSKQQQLANLAGLAAKQEQAIMQGGPQNPVCTVAHLVNTYRRMSQLMGFKDNTQFWNDEQVVVQMLQQAAAQPKQDPKMMEVQAKAQAQQAEMHMKAQMAQADHQLKAQAAAAAHQAAQETAKVKAEAEMQIAMAKLDAETKIGMAKLDAEMALARERMLMEMQLQQDEQAYNFSFRQNQPTSGRSLNGSGNGLSSGVRMGGNIG
jgi:hypothetical protein